MAYLTDRKRATGLGASRTGTANFWNTTVSSYGLLVLTPLFLLAFGPMLGASYEEVLARFAHPFPAVVTGLMIVVGFQHFKNGIRMVIEDYMEGSAREYAIIGTTILSYAAMAAGLFALVRLAL